MGLSQPVLKDEKEKIINRGVQNKENNAVPVKQLFLIQQHLSIAAQCFHLDKVNLLACLLNNTLFVLGFFLFCFVFQNHYSTYIFFTACLFCLLNQTSRGECAALVKLCLAQNSLQIARNYASIHHSKQSLDETTNIQ